MRFPTWKEVESDPEFQSLEPTKKKEYFGKWSKTAVDRAMQQGLYRDNDFASGFTGWYNQKAKEYGDEEEFSDFQQLSTRLRQPPKVGTSILEEITKMPAAVKSAIDQPLEAFGETAEVLGAPALAQTLKGAVEAPKDYKTAAESFMRPEEGEFEVAGFAPQYLPRAIVEQAGQLAGAIGTRIAGAAVGGAVGAGVGSVVPGLGTAAGVAGGTAVGAFTGPAVFEMAQIVGPVARERAKNNGRTEPNNEDLAWAWTTAGTSGALNAIGAKYIPGGEKLVGGISKKIAASILGEGLTESGQALAQQTGETILTEKGLTVSPKEAIAEGIIGGAAGGVATAIFERADKKPEDSTKAAATKAAADQLAEANKTALELSANNAPITAKVIQDQAAKDFSAIAETEEAVEEGERFAQPEDAITKQELKTQYAALSPEDLADTEATFRERLDDEDPEMRTFAQNALDAISEVRAEQARATKLPTDVLPTETPGATYGREADIYDVFADIRRRPMPPSGPAFESAQVIEEAARRADVLRRTPEGRELLRRELQGEEMVGGVRRATEEALATAPEPAEGDVFAGIRRPSRAEEAAITIEQQLTEDERIRRSQLGAEALREELAQVESLSRVADNTATDEEVVRLARQGLVNIQDGQNVITPRGEEVMQRGGAPLPRLTPEERAAEVAAAPAIVEQEPSKVYDETQTRIRGIQAPPAGGEIVLEPEPLAIQGGITKQEKQVGRGAGDREKQRGDAGVAGQALPRTIPELTEDQAETLRDFISLRKSQGREPNPEHVKRLAEYDARNAGVEVQQGDIVSNIVVGHPLFEAPQPELQNLVPIKVQNKEQLASSIQRTENVRNAAQTYIGQYQAEQAKAKTAAQKKAFAKKFSKSEFDRQRDILDYINNDVMPELDRMEKAAPTPAPTPVTTPPVTEAVTPAPAAPTPAALEVAPTPTEYKGKVKREYDSGIKAGETEMAKPTGVSAEAVSAMELDDMRKDVRAAKDKSAGNAMVRAYRHGKTQGRVNRNAPVFAEAVESYGITLPEGYTKQGDLYVYQPAATATTPAPAEAAPVGIAVGEPAEVAPPTRAEQPVIDPIGYGNALIDLFPTLKAAGVRAISMEESLADIERKWQQKQKSGKATRIDQLVYLANKKNTEDALAGNRVGGTWSRTDLRVAVSSSATPSAMAHEIGHAIMEIEFSKADKKTRDAIEAEYTKWFKEKYGKEGTPSVADQKRIWEWMEDSDWLNPKAPTPLEFRNPNWERYRSSFGEWFADEVAKWATTREKPKSLIDKFFSELAAKLSRLWNAVSENFSPNETLASWLDSITVASPSKVDPVTDGFQVGSRVGNKNARFLTYTIVEALPQNEAEKRNNERSYRVRDKKGKVTTMGSNDLVPLQERLELLEAAPEPAPATEAVVEEAPAERPKRRTKMQNIIDISTGVKRPKTKLTVNEMTALKDQIKLGARKRREDKRTQREFAKDLTQQLREAAIRGKVRPAQLRAITSKALQTQFDNEASILGFVNYANKVIENANYEKDLSDAKSAIKSAKRLAKQKKLAGNIKANLEKLANIDPRQIEPEEMVEVDGEMPISVAEFTAVLKEYMKAGGPVTAEGYIVVPDAEIADFLSKIGEQIETNRKATENLGLDGELATIADKTPEEIDAELARDEERRNRIEQKINGLAEEAQIGLSKYENPDITSEEKIVLDEMKRITLSDISIGERKEFIKVANNILVNNKFLGAQKFASIAKGQIGAVEAAKDAKTVKRNSATLKLYNVFGEDFGNLLNLGTQSFADTFRNLTGTQYLPRLLYQMGFGEIERGQANTNRARREITDGVQQRFKQIEKETGQKIANTQGVYSMGVAGNLIQIHPDETEAEGIQRMRGLIEKDIERKKRSANTEDRKTALYVEKALNEVYADSIQGILDNLNRLHPANYKALTFLMNEVLPEYKPMLKEHDELFNNQTENYENPYYLPIRYRSIGAEPKKPGELRGRATDSVTAPKQAPNSIKRIKNTVLPEGKQLDYNLTRNVLDSLSTQLEAAYTNPGWQQVYAFLKTPEAVEALGGVENYDFVTKRINGLSDSRERRIYQMDPFNQAADFVANMVRKIGTSIALGGVGQAAKQMPDQVATTIANVNDLSITTPAFTEIKAALPAMRQFSIGERGEIAGGSKWVNQLEGNFTKLQQFMQDGVWPKAMEAFENLNNFWLIPLKVSDTVAASHGWISYYKKYLKDNDIPFTNWDNEAELIAQGDRGRVEAGLYADQMIDIYQGSSDPTKMATFAQRGDSGGGNLLKTMIMPFSSFVIQQRSRILSDLRDVSYGDTDEKKVAAKGLAGTLLGIIIFHGVRRYALPFLTGGVAAAAYGLLGVDMEEPDEEERLEKERRVFRQFLGEVAANIFVGGYSAYAETRLIDAVNAAAYFYEIQTQSENVLDDKGEIVSWEKYRKERAPMYRYTGPGADSTLGMLDILPSQASESFDRLKDLADDEIMDSLTEEEQRVLILAALSETLYTMRLNDADVARMVKRMAKDVKDQAEARQKAERQLQRIYGQ